MSTVARTTKTALAFIIAITALCGQNFFSNAASYRRSSLQEMVKQAVAVAEVTVLKRSYPVMAADDYQRTYVEVAIQKTLKGSLPETVTLNLPGGLRGNNVYFVADSAEFQIGERAMVFVKTSVQGRFEVQDLGLGKFNIVERNGQTFVESALCPKAMETSTSNIEADLLTKSISYNDFCTMVSAYAANETPSVSPIKLALTMPQSGSHVCDISKPCVAVMDAALISDAAKRSNTTLNLALGLAFVALCAGIVVFIRRRNGRAMTAKSVATVMCAALFAGAILGGSDSLAYNLSGSKWNLDDTANTSKIQNGKVVVKFSTFVSKTNANAFTDVQASFNKWASISNCRLGFVNAGTTSNLAHSSNDNVNFVAWDANPNSDFSANTLGITYSVYTVGSVSYYVDCDIIFNDRDFNWGPGGAGNVKSVSLHEIGHFIGLNHTQSTSNVMYPIDHGLTALSSDEIAAAIALYPGSNNNQIPPSDTPPSATVSGSPLSGPAPLSSSFDASGSAQGTNPIASFTWTFGDGMTGSGAKISHTYTTPGTYSATVTVTDSKNLSTSASLTVNVTGEGTPVRGAFKLAFNASNKDSFSTTIVTQELATYKPGTNMVPGTVSVAGMQYTFSYNPVNHKTVCSTGLKMVVNVKNGTISLALTKASLSSAFSACGATNTSAFGTSVSVPVSITFCDGTQLAVSSPVTFTYYAVANKAGAGKF